MNMQGRILSIAGSDPSGGAGIQADIKTITALGGYAMSAITALTVQDTKQVYDVIPSSPEHVTRQIRVTLDDIGADAIKIGMLANMEILSAVTQTLAHYPDIPIILDPIILSSSGHALIEETALDYLKNELLPLCHLITPNIPEACYLTGLEDIHNIETMHHAGELLLSYHPTAVLITGGHLALNDVCDLLIMEEQQSMFSSPRIESEHTHGTGCTLASAIATGLAQGLSITRSVRRAHDYVHLAIKHAPQLGQGNGPLNHHVSLSDA